MSPKRCTPLVLMLLAGCGSGVPTDVPGQRYLMCYEDGTSPEDEVRVFVGYDGCFIAIAARVPLDRSPVVGAARKAFREQTNAVQGIVYRYRGDEVLEWKFVTRYNVGGGNDSEP